MKKIGIILLLLTAIILGILFILPKDKRDSSQLPKSTKQNKAVDYKASFAIYTNGTFRIFDDPRYHDLSEDIFLTSENPNVINIKTGNVTWSDFFKTLPMELKRDCLVTGTKQTFCSNEQYKLLFFINEVENPNALDEIIKPGDKLLVTYDLPNSKRVEKQKNSVPDSN